ncbi:TonB-dependent receptor plug domain-containing protein [Zobellia laminariae]|uniref:TonB-dependent receptor plug domain-containing protein n=1 Tax=Zobellia laminariae TaxID=248906 RepID=UPI0026F4142C|nr:TonB-dependent receptor plug domain-containing protein [Zobellia laminariae]WKX76730.1 TonB-dependent receptor plug domain-containing protein [Zobellia laminariae]
MSLANRYQGVNVLVKGTTVGTVADFDGNYTIKAAEGATLEFSYLGFVTKSISVGNETTINMVLQEDVALLEEVVVIGYGTSTKKDLVSSVSSVKSDVLENQPVARVDQALQGRATGVEVTSNNGTPGSGSTIRIRGNSSINGNNDPLYVIDGFIAGTGFNLNTINVNDIASIEILKDATALSIYGTRGASGVILITTKNGKGMAPETGSCHKSLPKFTRNGKPYRYSWRARFCEL